MSLKKFSMVNLAVASAAMLLLTGVAQAAVTPVNPASQEANSVETLKAAIVAAAAKAIREGTDVAAAIDAVVQGKDPKVANAALVAAQTTLSSQFSGSQAQTVAVAINTVGLGHGFTNFAPASIAFVGVNPLTVFGQRTSIISIGDVIGNGVNTFVFVPTNYNVGPYAT